MASERHHFKIDSRELDEGDIVGEFMLNALRLNDGFQPGLFTARTGLEPTALEPQLGQLCEQGLLVRQERGVSATTHGRRFLDSVVAEFLPD
jgi:oxygen-independent coproporphyrinogen-3 oxidase